MVPRVGLETGAGIDNRQVIENTIGSFFDLCRIHGIVAQNPAQG